MTSICGTKRRAHGGEALPNSKANRYVHWIDWIDYYGIAFLQELLELGPTFSGFLGSENLGI